MSEESVKQQSHGVPDDQPRHYDAVLYLSFGGPEGPDEVRPFLERVTAGRNVPPERLEEVAQHYLALGGFSPINDQNRAVMSALQVRLDADGPHLPIYWGNRNSPPLLTDTMRQMRDDGIERAICFVTSAYSSYSGCRQYREDIAAAAAEVGDGTPQIDKLRVFFNHPGFIEAQAERVSDAAASLGAAAHVVFTAHSIPLTMALTSSYVEQLTESCRLVIQATGERPWDLVYQSRSGRPQVPWLEPDVSDHLEKLHAEGVTDVLVVPIGFVSDHIEVRFDLDVEAAAVADRFGMSLVRAGSVGDHPAYVEMIRDLILERMSAVPERAAIGRFPASHDMCALDCCPAPRARAK